MNKDQVKGAVKEIKGGAKETLGKITNNPATEIEGKIEKNIGKTQRKLGDAKEFIQKDKD